MVVIAAVLAGFVVAAGIWASTQPDSVVEITVFDPPRSFCASQRAQSFSTSVSGIAETDGDEELRTEMARARAEIFRQTADRDDTPSTTGGELRALADELERDARGGDFTGASRAARALDERARQECR